MTDLERAADAASSLATSAEVLLRWWDDLQGLDADLLDRFYPAEDEAGETVLPDFREVALALRGFSSDLRRAVEGRGDCDYCGKPGSSDRPVRLTIVSPPVSGYRLDSGLFHEDCGAEAAADLVR